MIKRSKYSEQTLCFTVVNHSKFTVVNHSKFTVVNHSKCLARMSDTTCVDMYRYCVLLRRILLINLVIAKVHIHRE